jgi:hypothetical protein
LDSYLEIAAKILRAERRPLSPQAILAAAYAQALVPHHLHGRTQHKTLQARISEDIIAKRERSAFFRTGPGRFFLREFLEDQSIAEEFRQPFPARRRLRELARGPVLAIDRDALKRSTDENARIEPERILNLFKTTRYQYANPKQTPESLVLVRSFVCVCRGTSVLTYRVGRYRDDRNSFMLRRSIGFYAFVHSDEHNLFNVDDFGIVDAGVRASRIDLDIPAVDATEERNASLDFFIWSSRVAKTVDLIAVITFGCPNWFEPTRRRLALNELAWLDISRPVNNIDDFDPWSQMVLNNYEGLGNFAGHCAAS